MPGFPISGLTHSPIRHSRVQTLLALSDASLTLAASAPSLHAALEPFRRRFAGSQSAYDCVAFIHCFGVKGPAPGEWHALFSASAGLCAEEVTVLVAHAVTGGEAKGVGSERRTVMAEVVLGAAGVPGILDKVCALFEDWLCSVEGLHDALVRRAADEADRWWIAKVGEGRYVWVRGRDTAAVREAEAGMQEDALGDGMSMLARRIGVRVVKEVVADAVRRVTRDGVEAALCRVRERGELFVDVAGGRAVSVLIRKVMDALGMHELPRLPWE